MQSCKHDPFPGPPEGSGNDTITNPIDTIPTGKTCDPDTVYFEKDILPILSANCAYSGCHNAASASDGVILTDYTSVVNSADVRPFDPDGSDLYEVITETNLSDRMPPPPNSKLSTEQIDLISKWIMQGAQNLTCEACDTTGISFQNDIQSIFSISCSSCHSATNPSGGRSLVTHADITDALLNTNLLDRIHHRNNAGVMPPSGIKLAACKLRQIDAWINHGMPNN